MAADFRSDTVTRPTPAMRAAMAAAPVGDDVFGDDPSVNALEAETAALLGFEAALFVPSGTQSNSCSRHVGDPEGFIGVGTGAVLEIVESEAGSELSKWGQVHFPAKMGSGTISGGMADSEIVVKEIGPG